MPFSVNAQPISQAIRLRLTKLLLIFTLSRRIVDVMQSEINLLLSHSVQGNIDRHYHHGTGDDY